MKTITKTLSLLSIMAVIPGAMAATSRVSMTAKASPRLPSIAGYILSGTSSTSSSLSSGTTGTTYLADVDCIDNYTSCIKADDVCGSDFEECTTNVLFHGQMSKCLSMLYQCNSTGINALFGTSAIDALSNVSSYETIDGVQEVKRYTYPTDGSVLGQLIIGAGISNKLTTEQCVRRYTNCLKREDICGEDFELCTDQKSFKKQALLCDSTLARCQNDGKIQLFGSVANASSLKPATDSRIGTLIEEGASLAALNAVKTCNKVVDNCLVNSCVKNPFRCVEGISLKTIDTADIIAGAEGDKFNLAALTGSDGTELTTASDVRKLLKTQCLETIGANKYCHMTYREKMPTKRELGDPELQEEVFSLAYSARKAYANTKIQEEIKKFDSSTKDKCIDTISSCVMRSCGGGIGSVCYKKAKSSNKIGEVNVNSKNTYNDIKAGCSAIVNADANCIYAAQAGGEDGYQYSYVNNDTFTTLFPEYTGTENDQIGAVATLNSILATSYNDAAIESMKKQCQTTALSCVKSMCGKDYTNCYRNRTDIVSGTYDTGNSKLDRSMNKMGGVLDYNIVIGLCMNTVKTSSVCEEHLKVAAADWRDESYKDSDSWGDATSVRGGWLGANTTSVKSVSTNNVLIACAISKAEHDAKGDMCQEYAQAAPVNEGNCDGVMDEDGCMYTEPVYQSMSEYVLENAGKTLFQELLSDVEREAQAKYNAKLTKEQNVCLAQNNGGIRGASENGSTFMWVKLKGNKVPKNYNTKGLSTKQFTASNDLYGSFCRARITVTSDDKNVQEVLAQTGESTAYFAVGDAFTCGSWISSGTLKKITNIVGDKARKDAGEGSASEERDLMWTQLIGTLVGGAGGYIGTNALQNNGLLGGTSKATSNEVDECLSKVGSARDLYNKAIYSSDKATQSNYYRQAVDSANSALRSAKNAGVDVDVSSFQMGTYTEAVAGVDPVAAQAAVYEWKPEDRVAVNAAVIGLRSVGGGKQCGSKCKTSLETVEGLLNGTPSAQNGTKVILELQNAKLNCNLSSDGKTVTEKCKDVNIPNSLGVVTVRDAVAGRSEVKPVAGGWSSEYNNFMKNLDNLENACQNAKSGNAKDKTKKTLINIGGAVVGGLATNMIAYRVAKKTKEAGYESAANAAADEWMKEVGDHIQCYLGTEELGSYGDTIAFTVEE